MSDKKIDGIKKMSKSELEKSRELVLQSINEYEKTNQPQSAKKAVNNKKVDGIFTFREKSKNKERDSAAEKRQKELGGKKEKGEKINLLNKFKTVKFSTKKEVSSKKLIDSVSKIAKTAPESKKSTFLKDSVITSVDSRQSKQTDSLQASALAEQSKDVAKKEAIKASQKEKSKSREEVKKAIKKESVEESEFGLTPALAKAIEQEKTEEKKSKKIIKKEEAAEAELAADFLKREKKLEKEEEGRKVKEEKFIKKDLKIKKKREREEKRNKKEAEKKKKLEEKIKFKKEKKENRRKKIKDIKTGIKKLFSGFVKGIKVGLSRTVKILLAGLIVFILLYTVFAVVLLKLDVDNKAARLISEYFVVPAIITKNGIIEYYTYKDIKRFTLTNIDKNNKESVKLATVEMVVVSDLVKKYGLIIPGGNIYDNELRAEIAKRLALDTGINQVGINRIKKIKEMIDEGNDFVKISNKYGDLQDLITISKQNENHIAYSQKVKDLGVNEVSDIIYMPEGYYIFRCYDKSNDRSDLSYVLVKAKSLEEYIMETVRGYSLWSLAE